MKVCMFVFNNCAHDARVLKEAKTLTEAGYDVQIIALSGQGLARTEERDGFRILRVDVLLPGERVALATSDNASAASNTARVAARGGVGSVLLRPLAPIYDWARKRPSGPVRRLLVAIYRPYSFWQYSRQAWRIVKHKPAHVYHCHDLNTLHIGYLARRRHGGKLVYDAHELTPELAYVSRPERLGWRVMERFLIRRADTVITTGSHRAQYLVTRYGIAPPTVLLNCPPLALAQASDDALRERLGLEDGAVPLVLYQGGFIPGRGLDKLVLAARYVHNGLLVLMGWGTEEAVLRGVVRREGLEGRVYFTEPVPPDELVRYCMSASAGVVIYRNTGLNNYYATPNKLYEYIHAGLPVVSSDFPALKEIVEGYGLGCTFDPDDPESIAGAINRVLADEQRYNKMKSNALAAARIFNWETESRKLLELYRGLEQ
ncbi:MAG: glycosyltransferase family 4 protein [Dehalococcoidia bacterium]